MQRFRKQHEIGFLGPCDFLALQADAVSPENRIGEQTHILVLDESRHAIQVIVRPEPILSGQFPPGTRRQDKRNERRGGCKNRRTRREIRRRSRRVAACHRLGMHPRLGTQCCGNPEWHPVRSPVSSETDGTHGQDTTSDPYYPLRSRK